MYRLGVNVRHLVIALLAMWNVAAWAQDYPTRVIRVIVPFPPAGATDNYARVIGKELQESLGQSVIVENRAGATGVIGSELVKRAPADGHTLLFTSNTAHILGPLPHNPRPFDPAADFTPISKVVRYPLYLVAHPSLPVRSLKEFIALARSRPGQLAYASSGQAGTSHLVTELFNAAAGIKATHVPFKGTSPALQSVMSGETQYIFNNIGVSQPMVLAGRMRGFAVTGEKRSPALPEVPTFAELGVRGLEEACTWLGMLAPANLPQPVLTRLNGEVARIMRTPGMEKRVQNDGYVAAVNSPAQFRTEIQAEVATWSKVIRERGIKPE